MPASLTIVVCPGRSGPFVAALARRTAFLKTGREEQLVEMSPCRLELAAALQDIPEMDDFDGAIGLPCPHELDATGFAILDCFRRQVSQGGDRNLLLL